MKFKKHVPAFLGKNHPNWKCRKYLSSNEDVMIKKPHHLNYDTGGYMEEHVLKMSKKLGRDLKYFGPNHPDNEIVHHKDGDKLNNKLSNLQLMKNREHSILHLHSKLDKLRLTKVHGDERRDIHVVKNLLPNREEVSIIRLGKHKTIGSCIHNKGDEYFAVIEGKVTVVGSKKDKIYKTGESGIFPKLSPHLFYAHEESILMEWGIPEDDKKHQNPKMKNIIIRLNNRLPKFHDLQDLEKHERIIKMIGDNKKKTFNKMERGLLIR